MFAARQRIAGVARQSQRATRTYASDAHGKAHHVNESFGKGSILTVAVFFGGVLFWQFTPAEGENSSIYNLINKYTSRSEHWEEINKAHYEAVKQASFDRTLFKDGGDGQRFVDVSYPEAIQSHSARNIRAGHLMNIDHVVEHYRQKHLKEEDRKASKLASEQR